MEKLPVTSYVRLVDICLIIGQLFIYSGDMYLQMTE